MFSFSSAFLAWSWFFLSLIISASNDVIVKSLGSYLPGFEVSFLRFFFGALCLALIYPNKLKKSVFLAHHKVHFSRALLLCIGMGLWSSSLSGIALSQAMMVNLSIPIITLILSAVLLKESVHRFQWSGALCSFGGIALTLNYAEISLSSPMIGLVIAALFFSLCDVLNKISAQESLLSSLFFTAFYSMLLTSPIAYAQWQQPQMLDILLTALIGMNGNLMFYAMLKAFQHLDLAQVAPVKYFEFFLATFLGWALFGEVPTLLTFLGAGLVLSGSAIALQPYKQEQRDGVQPDLIVMNP